MSETKTPSRAVERDDKVLLERAHRDFRLVCDAEAPQRTREREDLLYQTAENQWSDAAKRERSGGSAGGVQTPPRPMLSISLLRQPQQLVYNQAARAKIGVNLHPVSEDADDELAEIKQGLYRRIERDGMANQARLWAFDRAEKCGRGWYRVITQYDEDSDDTWDQEISFERILYQECVYMDPAAQKPDCSDARWAFVVAWMALDDFQRDFPNAKAAQATGTLDWAGLVIEAPEWVKTSEGGKKAVLVAEYWYKDVTKEKLTSSDGRVRERETVKVYCANMTGHEILDVQEWNGKLIPLIPVIGVELQPVDNERRWEGMTRPARHAQEFHNFAASSLVEALALEPKAPFQGYVGQFETDKAKWDQINTRNFPYVESDVVTVDGKPAPLPQRMQIDSSKMQIAAQAIGYAKDWVQASTAVFEPALGELPQRKDAQSGRAILALQGQTDAGTSHYLESLRVALAYEARVVLDLMPAIYDRPGRITRVLGTDDEPKTVMLGASFVRDQRGFPVPARPGQEREAKNYDLRRGKYAISVDIGKSHQTRLEAGQAFVTEVAGAAPQLLDVIGDLVFKYRDEPGAKEIAERLRKQIAATHPGMIDDGAAPAPEIAQAQIQALTQQLQAAQQQLQGAAEALRTDQAKHEATIAAVELKARADVEIARMDNATKIAVARISAAKESLNREAEAAEELIATGLKVRAQAEQTAVEQQHETRLRRESMAHEAAMSAASRTAPQPDGGNV